MHYVELDQFIGRNFLVTVHGPLNPAIVSAVARHQEDYVETVTSDVWRLEQRVTGGNISDPEEFVNERTVADGQKEYLRPAMPGTRRSRRSPPGRPSSSRPRSSAPCAA